MRTRKLGRHLALLAAATVLLPLASTQAGAITPEAAPRAGNQAAPVPGAYISPWGDAEVKLSAQSLKWFEEEGLALEAISPFKLDADGKGFTMPIGSTAGDHLDSKGRIFYPGGLKIHDVDSGDTFTLKPTWIRVMPRPGYSAGIDVNGKSVSEETQIGDTNYAEVMAGARPSPTGFRLERAPFYFTKEAVETIETHTEIEAPPAGTPLFTLTPHFDYVPTSSSLPGFPG